MAQLFTLSGAVKRSPDVEEWLSGNPSELYSIAREWFGVMRNCGSSVTELLHDGCPVACVKDAAFCYVNVFKAHVNVGFYVGAFLDDPNSLLEGTGKKMRHVKIRPDDELDKRALKKLIKQAYFYVSSRLDS